MPLDLTALDAATRVLFAVDLAPLQGDRFQPTGFPNLGAATYQVPTEGGGSSENLLVESPQSMANRLEETCWDSARDSPIKLLNSISHIKVTRDGTFLTDSMLASHRINSPYILEGKDKSFLETLKKELGGLDAGPIDRAKFARVLFRFDVGSLIHGCFLAKSDLAGGRLRMARALSSFIEAEQVEIAASGGVKNDHVNPSGDTKKGFGNVPFARDEFTARRIVMYVNLDLAQIQGYGLNKDEERLLILLSLYKVRRLLEGDLRLRTACDLGSSGTGPVLARRPEGFVLPSTGELETDLVASLEKNAGSMVQTTVTFDEKIKAGKGGDA